MILRPQCRSRLGSDNQLAQPWPAAQYLADAQQIARQRLALRDTVDPPLQVPHPPQRSADLRAQIRPVHQRLDRVEPFVDLGNVEQRAPQPAPQQPPAHGSKRLVQHAQETAVYFAAAHRLRQFEIAPRGFVQRHELAQTVTVQPHELREGAGLHLLQVGKNRGGGSYCLRLFLQAEPIQAADTQMPLQSAASRVQLHLPGFDLRDDRLQTVDQRRKAALFYLPFGCDQFAGLKAAHLIFQALLGFCKVAAVDLRRRKFPRGDIAKGNAGLVAARAD